MTAQPPPSAPPPGWTPPPLGWTAPPPVPNPAPPAWSPPYGWTPPVPGPEYPPPVAPGPGTPRGPRRGRLLVAAVLGIALIAAGVGLWALLGRSGPSPTPSPGVPTAPVGAEGGDLGRPVTLTGRDGTATLTATAATWTPEGDLAPEEGTSYLIVDVEVKGMTGEVSIGAVFTVAVAADGSRHSLAYGPVLIPALASTRLKEGDTAAGQVGFQLTPGPVRVEFQDPAGTVLGSVAITGP